MEKQKSQCEHRQPIEQTRGMFCMANEVSLAAVNQIYIFYEAMNGCKNLKIH